MASVGPVYPSVGESATSGDANEVTWVTPANIQDSDTDEAQITAATFDSPDPSYYLVARGFDFSAIPDGSTIDGITVEVNRRSIIASSGIDREIRLRDASGTLVGDDKHDAVTVWPGTLTTKTYGGAADTWNAGLTAADVKDPDFGVSFQAQANIANADIGVAWIRVTVNYTAPTPTTTGTARISLAGGNTPETRTAHSIKVRARVTSGAGKIRAALYEGTTNITDTSPGYLESSALTTSLADYTLAIADADAAAIGSYSDLELRLWGYSAGGGSIVYEIDQAWLEIPAAGVTAVSKTLAASFNVIGRVGKTVAASYNVQRSISQTLAASYNKRVSVSKTLAASFNLAGRVSKTLNAAFNLRVSVSKTLAASYNKQVSVLKTLAASLTVKKAISKTIAASYGVAGLVLKTVAAAFNVRVNVAKTLAASYVKQVSISKTLAAAYNVKKQISKTLAVSYNLLGAKQTGIARVSLASGGNPSSRTQHSIKIRARVTGGTGTLRAALYEGSTNRSGNLESSSLSGSLADYTLSISDGNAASITDYSDLEIRFWGYSVAGDSAVFEVDQIWLETPAAVAAVSKTLAASFNVRGSISKTLAASFNIQPQAVLKTLAASYAIGGRVSKSLAVSYLVKIRRAAAGFVFLWGQGASETTSVSKTFSASYNVKASVSKTIAATFNVRSSVSKTLAASYAIQSLSAVVKSLAASLNVQANVSKTLAASYNKRAIVSKTLAASYTVKFAVAKTIAASFSVQAVVSKTIAASYNKRGIVSKTVAASYNVIGRVGRTIAASFNVRVYTSKTLAASYNILSLSAVSKNLAASFNVRSIVSKLLEASFNKNTTASKSVAASYNLRGIATKTLAASYSTRTTASKTVAASYTVRAAITKTVGATYTVRTSPSKTLAASFNLRATVSKTLLASYSLLTLSAVSKSFLATFNVRSYASKTLSASYKVRVFVPDTLLVSYNVRKQVSDSLEASYRLQGAGLGYTYVKVTGDIEGVDSRGTISSGRPRATIVREENGT